MSKFPLTVHPETDGELCGPACPMMYDEGDGCHGYGMACAAFGDSLERARREPDPRSPPGRSWVLDRYRRRSECIEAERTACAEPDPIELTRLYHRVLDAPGPTGGRHAAAVAVFNAGRGKR